MHLTSKFIYTFMKNVSLYLIHSIYINVILSDQKRWSAPKILEKALKYIPELLAELRRLQSLAKEKSAFSNETNKRNKSHASDNSTSITITEATNGGEFFLQICAKRATSSNLLSGLMFKVEENGMSVKGLSSVEISDDITCCHLHIQVLLHTGISTYINWHISLSFFS